MEKDPLASQFRFGFGLIQSFFGGDRFELTLHLFGVHLL